MTNNENEKKVASLVDEQEIPHISRGFAVTVICVFMAVLLLPTLIWGALKLINLGNPSIMETLNFDTGENRNMASFPTKFDPKTITSEIETWYNDNLPFRSVLYKAQANIKNAIEEPYKTTIMPLIVQLFPSAVGQKPDDPIQNEIKDPYGDDDDYNYLPPAQDETVPDPEVQDEGDPTCKHVMDAGETENEASCSDYGTILHSCTKCSYSYVEYTKKLEHDYVCENEQTTRCDMDVENIYVCSMCDASYTVTLPRKHVGIELETVEATVTEYGYTLNQCTVCGGQYRTNVKAKLTDTTYQPVIYYGDSVLEGKHKWLFYRKNDSEAFYKGTNLMSASELVDYTATLQRLNDLCKERGITLQIAIFPNKEQVYSEFYPDNITVVDEYKRVERLVDHVKANSDVNIIYPLEELLAAKPYWELYYKNDTHWNHAGAFIALQAMYEQLGLESTNLMSLPVWETNLDLSDLSYIDLINLSGVDLAKYRDGKDYTIRYRENVQILAEVGNNETEMSRRTTSNGPYDLNFVMIGDSYRCLMSPYFEKDFTSCFHTHRKKVGNQNAQPAILEADILILSVVERREAEIITMANSIIELLSNSPK